MASGIGAGFGADMLQEVLRRKLLEQAQQAQQQQFAQKLAEDARQSNMRNDVERGTLALGNRRTDEDARQFNEQAPVRMANVRHLGASADSLDRAPVEAQKARDFTAGQTDKAQTFTTSRDKTQHGYQMQEIGASGANALRVAQTNHPVGPTAPANEYGDERALRMRDMIGEILPVISRRTAGVGSVLSGIPETGARDLRAKLEALKSNIGFKELQEMRNASKTGGALGQVSDKENALLSSSLGSLDQGQSPEQLSATLKKIVGSLDRWDAAKAKYGAGGAPAAPKRIRYDMNGNVIKD